MKIAAIRGSNKVVNFSEGTFTIDDEVVAKKQIQDYDNLGVLEWVDGEIRNWILALPVSAEVTSCSSLQSPMTTKASWKAFCKRRKGLIVAVGIAIIGTASTIGVFALINAVSQPEYVRQVGEMPQLPMLLGLSISELEVSIGGGEVERSTSSVGWGREPHSYKISIGTPGREGLEQGDFPSLNGYAIAENSVDLIMFNLTSLDLLSEVETPYQGLLEDAAPGWIVSGQELRDFLRRFDIVAIEHEDTFANRVLSHTGQHEVQTFFGEDGDGNLLKVTQFRDLIDPAMTFSQLNYGFDSDDNRNIMFDRADYFHSAFE